MAAHLKPTNLNGQFRQNTQIGEYNSLSFIITQHINKINTMILVEIIKCSNSGGVSDVGLVDVKPLLNQVDSQGNPVPHETIFNVPYFRVQGGGNALILDPVPGDKGLCGFCSRDISKIKSTKKRANPGSARKFSYSDGLYMGGFLNGTPTQYVRFSSSGIEIKSTNEIKFNAPTITISGDINQSGGSVSIGGAVSVSGNAAFAGSVKQSGIDLAKITHTHAVSGAATGPGIP